MTIRAEVREIVGCLGKEGYPSRKATHDSINAARRKWPKLKFSAYRCSICGQWHVGHERKAKTKSNNRYKKQWRKHLKNGKVPKVFVR